MSILAEFTDTRRNKIKEAMKALGAPTSKPQITSANRTLVRTWLNGLGFPAHAYENASLAQLQSAYHSFTLEGYALGLVPFVQAAKSDAQDIDIHIAVMSAITRANVPLQDLEYEGVMKPEQEQITNYLTNKGESMPPKKQKQASWDWTVDPKKTDATITAKELHEMPVNPDALKAIAALMNAISKPQTAEIDESRVIELIQKHAQATRVEIVTGDSSSTIPTGLHHKVLPDVIKMLSAGVNVLMVGPAGSGKTTIADQAAKALDIPFYFNGALSSEYKLSGFVDAQGRIVSTAFRKAFETGGLYLFDEIDASMPDALLAFNAALANGHADFPDGAINRHEKFLCMAAANTYGKGADRIYVGRNQLDGASLDRFCVVNVDYDEKLERTLASNDSWTDFVLKIRSAIFDLKVRHVVSPRASINGARLLAAGMDRLFVEESVIWKGMDADTKNKVRAKAGV